MTTTAVARSLPVGTTVRVRRLVKDGARFDIRWEAASFNCLIAEQHRSRSLHLVSVTVADGTTSLFRLTDVRVGA